MNIMLRNIKIIALLIASCVFAQAQDIRPPNCNISGSTITCGGTSSSVAPGGSNLQIQYNNSGSFAGNGSLGPSNTILGTGAGSSITTSLRSTIYGVSAATSTISQSDITAFGFEALKLSVTGGNNQNTAFGSGAGAKVTSGNEFTAVGFNACNGVSTGNENTCLGWLAGGQQNGNFNVWISAGVSLTGTGNGNTVVGDVAVRNATDANALTLVGNNAAKDATGSIAGWTGVGQNVFLHNTNTNSNNDSTAIGRNACSGANGSASFRGISCLGSNTGGVLSSATNSTLIGGGTSKVGNATFASGSGVILMGSGNVTVDTPAAGTSNYINIENVITVTGTDIVTSSNITITGLTKLSSGYTIGGTLPAAGTAGRRAYVTNQLTTCAVTGAALTGGGSVVCPVFDNGSAWVGG